MQTITAQTSSDLVTIIQQLTVEGMCCRQCARTVEAMLLGFAGCVAVHVDLDSGTVVAESDRPLDIVAVADIAAGAGYEVVDVTPLTCAA